MYDSREDRINALAKLNSANSYLEIGVSKGSTFLNVDIAEKIAVDPQFRFDTEEHEASNVLFYEVTSDAYFASIAPDNNPKFDLIYLDGLHTFEQTFRDLCASMFYSHKNTIWLIDDTHPVSLFSADPDMGRAKKLSDLAGYDIKSWMGDVYKVIFAVHDFFPQLSYRTFTGHGQTVLWFETRKDFEPCWNSLEKISRLGFDDFIEFRDLILLSHGTDIIGTIANRFDTTLEFPIDKKFAEAC